jgi:hypothetical protein
MTLCGPDPDVLEAMSSFIKQPKVANVGKCQSLTSIHMIPTGRISISVRSAHQLFVLYLSCRSEIYVQVTMIVFSRHINSLDAKQKRSLLPLLFVVLLLRSRLITGPRDVFNALKKVAGIQKPTPEELEQARQQLYRKNPDGTKSLLVTYRGRISEVSIVYPGTPVIGS